MGEIGRGFGLKFIRKSEFKKIYKNKNIFLHFFLVMKTYNFLETTFQRHKIVIRTIYEGGLKSFRPNNDTRHFFLIFFKFFYIVSL